MLLLPFLTLIIQSDLDCVHNIKRLGALFCVCAREAFNGSRREAKEARGVSPVTLPFAFSPEASAGLALATCKARGFRSDEVFLIAVQILSLNGWTELQVDKAHRWRFWCAKLYSHRTRKSPVLPSIENNSLEKKEKFDLLCNQNFKLNDKYDNMFSETRYSISVAVFSYV